MNPEVKKRLKWIKVYEKTKNAGMTCLRCGISRPTLRKWFTIKPVALGQVLIRVYKL
jgi:hypothetical protein